jgi:hypothetical protein
MQALQHQYERPTVSDYGDLWSLTATFHPLLGQAGTSELSFSSPYDPGNINPGDESGGNVQNASGSGGVGSGGGSGGAAGGGGGGAGGGGEKLPFTGLATALVAAVGAGLVTAGDALRRAVRRRPKT